MAEQNRELRAFKAHYKKLVSAIQTAPETLAVALHSKDIIGRALNLEVATLLGVPTTLRTIKLLDAVEGKISENPANLDVFLTVLREEPPLVFLADSISKYLKCEALMLISVPHVS